MSKNKDGPFIGVRLSEEDYALLLKVSNGKPSKMARTILEGQLPVIESLQKEVIPA